MNIAVFLDRDGTTTKSTRLITRPEQLVLEERAAEGIRMMNELGLKVIVVTNQPQIARGMCSEEDVLKINQKMVEDLAKMGAKIDAVYYCPHHPEMHEDVSDRAKKYRIDCECRKPKAGMLRKAAQDFGIDLSKSYMIGDTTRDMLTARGAGCTAVLVSTGEKGLDGKFDAAADFTAADLLDAAKIISSLVKPKIKAVILAGGRGERLMPLTKDVPKPMIDIGGKPAVQHHIELLKSNGIEEVAVLTSYLGHKIKEQFGDGAALGMKIHYPEEPEPLGSGGAIRNAAEFLKEADHFVMLNGDVLTNIDIRSVLDFHLANRGIATLVVRESDHPKDSDVVVLEGNRVIRYVGRGQEDHRIANTGIMIFRKDILGNIPEGFSNIEKDVVFKILGKEKVFGYMSDAYIKDFGTHERLKSVRQHYSGLA